MVKDAWKPKCRETLERAHLFLDGEILSIEERQEIEVHLEDCGPCYERIGLQREMTVLIARLRGTEPCPQSLKARILGLLSPDKDAD